jgi:hypothetical protein
MKSRIAFEVNIRLSHHADPKKRDFPKKADITSAIPGQHLSALISMGYIFVFRKDNAIFFNDLGQNYPDRVSPKRLCH